MLWVCVAAFAAPLLVTLAGTRLMIGLAPRLGLVDEPEARKVHARSVPLGGGVAIFVGVMLATLGAALVAWLAARFPALAGMLPAEARPYIAGVLSKSQQLGLIAVAGTVQMALGLADDWRSGGLDYRVRLLVETGLVAGLVLAGLGLHLPHVTGWANAILTVLWVVGLTNALNFLDNMDGLAGGVTLLAAAFFAAVMALVGSLFVAACFLIVAGAAVGFLRWNWAPAKIFMGDAGSNFLGFWLGMLSVAGTYVVTPFSPVTLVAPLCILAVPIYDSVSVIALRLYQGKSPFQADRQHFSHRLARLGMSGPHAVLAILLVTATTGLGGLLLYFLDPARAWYSAGLVAMQVVCMLGVVALMEVSAHRRTGLFDRPDAGP